MPTGTCNVCFFLSIKQRTKWATPASAALRHATLMLLKTKNVKAISARLGHASIKIALDTYAHLLPQMEDELVAAMDEILSCD